MDNSQKSIAVIVQELLKRITNHKDGTLSLTNLQAYIQDSIDRDKFNHLIQKYKLWPDVPDFQIQFSTVQERLNKLQRHQCRHPEEKPCCDPCQPYCPHCCPDPDHGCCERCCCLLNCSYCMPIPPGSMSTRFPSDHNHCMCSSQTEIN